MTVFYAAASGAIGAVLRYVVSGAAQRRSRSALPTGTAVVNLAGALAVGLAAGLTDPGSVARMAAFGFLGGFTTFSTWMIETVGLGLVPRPRAIALANVAGQLFAGVALAAAGYTLTT